MQTNRGPKIPGQHQNALRFLLVHSEHHYCPLQHEALTKTFSLPSDTPPLLFNLLDLDFIVRKADSAILEPYYTLIIKDTYRHYIPNA